MDPNIIRGKVSAVWDTIDTYDGVLSVGDSSYVDGGMYEVEFNIPNPIGAPKLDINGIGAKPMKIGIVGMLLGQLSSANPITFRYDLAADSFIFAGGKIDGNLIAGEQAFTKMISVAITADQDDWNPTLWASDIPLITVTSTGGPHSITGLKRTSPIAFQSSTVRIMNKNAIGGDNVILTDEDSSSTAANRFNLGGARVVLKPGQWIDLMNDSVNNRWSKEVSVSTRTPILVSLEDASTNSLTYARLGTFFFEGTDVLGTPDNIQLNAWKGGGGTDADFRIVDITNAAAVIGTVIDITSTDDGNIVDLGTLSNLPTGRAVFEIQGLRTGGGATANVSAIAVNF